MNFDGKGQIVSATIDQASANLTCGNGRGQTGAPGIDLRKHMAVYRDVPVPFTRREMGND
jgi:hypothetical protein